MVAANALVFCVWRAYEQSKDEPGFTRAATLPEIRAKDGTKGSRDVRNVLQTRLSAQKNEVFLI